MKITQEEQIKAIKNTMKVLKGDVSKTTKAVIIASYMHDVTYLLKELKKSGLRIVAGDDRRVVNLVDHLPKKALAKAQKPSV